MKANIYQSEFKTRLQSKIDLNKRFSEEQNSFRAVVNLLRELKDTPQMKQFLNMYCLKFENLVDFNYVRQGLDFHKFEDGHETICRRYKNGKIVRAKYTCWLVISAAERVRKAELLESWKARETAATAATPAPAKGKNNPTQKNERKKAA